MIRQYAFIEIAWLDNKSSGCNSPNFTKTARTQNGLKSFGTFRSNTTPKTHTNPSNNTLKHQISPRQVISNPPTTPYTTRLSSTLAPIQKFSNFGQKQPKITPFPEKSTYQLHSSPCYSLKSDLQPTPYPNIKYRLVNTPLHKSSYNFGH